MIKNYNHHQPVYENEVINYLSIKPNGVYIDCTLGRCGHTKKIISKLSTGFVIGIDRDIEAINYAKQLKLNNLRLEHDKFSNLDKIFQKHNLNEVDGIIFDLGVSSPQLDNVNRGFSYNQLADLDMRMDQSQKKDAKQVINSYSLNELIRIFRDYGESKYAYNVAKNIVNQRKNKVINTTFELNEIIKDSLPAKELSKHKHPSRVFYQAIRMEVNNELEEIKIALNAALKHLKVGSRLILISFHSLENNIIKSVLKEQTKVNEQLSYLPTKSNITNSYKLIKHKILDKSDNPRSRSARLHIIEREV